MKKKVLDSKNTLKEMALAFPIDLSVHKAEDGGYWVEASRLGGVFSEGTSVAEALHNFKLSVFDYFDIPKKLQKPECLEIRALDIPEPKSARRPAFASLFATRAFVTA